MLEFYNYKTTDLNFVNGKTCADILEEHIKNNDYSVKANGNKLQCYDVRVSKMAFNRIWPGHQRDMNQTEVAAMVQLGGNEKLEFEITAKKQCSLRKWTTQIKYQN